METSWLGRLSEEGHPGRLPYGFLTGTAAAVGGPLADTVPCTLSTRRLILRATLGGSPPPAPSFQMSKLRPPGAKPLPKVTGELQKQAVNPTLFETKALALRSTYHFQRTF